jgi:hypothetical protein
MAFNTSQGRPKRLRDASSNFCSAVIAIVQQNHNVKTFRWEQITPLVALLAACL